MKKMIIAALGIVMLASCKKEKVSPAAVPVPAANKNLIKFTNVVDNGTPETETYTYDANGRIATLKDDDYMETFNFVSASSLVVEKRTNADNSLLNTKECTLNDKGYVTKIVIKNSVGTLQGTYDFSYNADGYMTAQKLTYPSGATVDQEYEISNGNTVSSKLYYDNVLNASRTITYDNTKTDKTQLGFAYYWQVPGLFGKGSKNLKSEFKQLNTSGTLTFHAQYSYELDAAGYPTKQINNYLLTGKQGVYTFIYQ